MIDADGEEWLPARDAAARLGVPPATVRKWVSRQQVRAHTVGRSSWVNYPDCAKAEQASRKLRATRRRTRD